MGLPQFDYARASSLQEGLELLAQSGGNAAILAGGTDLVVNMKHRVVQPATLVGIRSLPELTTISEDKEGAVLIGACVILSDLVSHPIISEKLPALRDAVHAVASKHIRNMATIGGNICLTNRCWYYNQSREWRAAIAPCLRTGGNLCHAIKGAKHCHAVNNSDTAPMLMALDAQVCLCAKGRERWVPVREFYREDGRTHTALESNEILTCIRIPKSAEDARSVFIKIAHRKGLDFALGSIGASITQDGKHPSDAALVINSIGSKPIILKKAASIIMESGLGEQAVAHAAQEARSETGPVTNLFSSADYKRQLVETLTKRALLELQAQSKKKGRVRK
jgi:4-hydroxybenzoyl-CoA reductase subunit beta